MNKKWCFIRVSLNMLDSGKYATLLNEHRKAQGLEREKLAKHRNKCYKNPEKYLGICIDGMDQKKTELPHFTRCPKSMDEKYFIAIHVVGCLVFNRQLTANVFLNYPNIHNDSNLTIHVIQHILNTWEGVLPPVLYLQLDNTARENKNKFVMAYLNMLVYTGVFRKVKVSFLLVGHTHDQIDQMFSKFSSKLNKRKAFRLDTLSAIIKESYNPKANIFFVHEVADFKKFVSDKDQPNSKGIGGFVLRPLHGISAQKQFRMKRVDKEDGETETMFHAKHLSTTLSWGEPVDFVRYIPSSRMWVAPQMALKAAVGVGGDHEEPDHDNDDDDVRIRQNHLKVLEKYRKAIEVGFNYFEDEDRLWWLRFFDTQKDVIMNHLDSAQWSFDWTWPESNLESATPPPVREPEIDSIFVDKIAGASTIMYSGTRKKKSDVGDFKDLEVNTKFAMICVAAHRDSKGRPFWMAKVTDVLSRSDDIPDKIKISWFVMDSQEVSAMDGKYFPEVDTNNRVLEDELCLAETTVYAYNFALLANNTLPVQTRRIIQAAMLDTEVRE